MNNLKKILLGLIPSLIILVGGLVYAQVYTGSDGRGDYIYLDYTLTPELTSYVQSLEGVSGIVVYKELTIIYLNPKTKTRNGVRAEQIIRSLDAMIEQNRVKVSSGFNLPFCMMDNVLGVPIGYYSSGGKITGIPNDPKCLT